MNRRLHRIHLTVGQRLAAGFATLVCMLIAVAAFNGLEFHNMEQRLREIVEINNRKGTLAYQMLSRIDDMAIRVRSIALADVRDIKVQLDALSASEAAYHDAEKALSTELDEHGATERERQLMQELSEAAKKTLPWVMRAAKEGEEGANNEATTTLNMQVQPNEKVWREKVGELVAIEESLTRQAYDAALQAQQRASLVGAVVVMLAVLAGTALGWQITRSVKRPIDQAIQVAECVAEGNLTTHVEGHTRDEIGRLLGAIATMQDRLRGLVGEIRLSTQQIRVASNEVAVGNLDLSQRTERAASRLQETASSMDQLAGMVRQSADAATQANRLASSASAVAGRGGEVVGNVVQMMGEIGRSSKKIADIIGVIDGIAFQTNILALNAAVEAARAGEQGRGFAVVAGEVRTLAQRSAGAAKEIKALIGASQHSVEEGARLVQEAGSTMTEIVASVHSVTGVMEEITVASKEQSGGIGDINHAIAQLDQMTQQNAALVEQSAAAAESLREQANRLASMVETFRLQENAALAPT